MLFQKFFTISTDWLISLIDILDWLTLETSQIYLLLMDSFIYSTENSNARVTSRILWDL